MTFDRAHQQLLNLMADMMLMQADEQEVPVTIKSSQNVGSDQE